MTLVYRKILIRYLLIAFGGAWALMILGITSGSYQMYQYMTMAAMLVPTIAVLIVYRALPDQNKTGITWSLNRKNLKQLAFAWFMPTVFTILGCLVYFLVFPSQFDAQYTSLAIAAGIDPNQYDMQSIMISQIINCLTIAPLANTFFALGEEIGWRGFMTPILMELRGRRRGQILAGIIWNLWHAPLIVMAGYQYGVGYYGAPWSGVLANTVFVTATGIILNWLYEKGDSIMLPAIFHGGINGVAALGLYMMHELPTSYLFGPSLPGLISVIPMALFACWILWKNTGKTHAIKIPYYEEGNVK